MTYLNDQDIFTAFNIMEDYSCKNPITAGQAARIRKVIAVCPFRWNYKSDWVFTGKAEK